MKLKLISLAVASLAFNSTAFAQAGTVINIGGSITTTQCPVLQSGITTGLTQKVSGAFVCRTADATAGTIHRVGMGTCHPGGSAKARTVTCSIVTPASDGPPAVAAVYSTNCSASNFDSSGTVLTGSAGQAQVSGIAMFGGTTLGGTVAQIGMASNACDSSGIMTLVGQNY